MAAIAEIEDFSESKFTSGLTGGHQVLYHAVKVFIFGCDVTGLLTSKLSIKYADRDGINVCSFTLSNQLNALVFTAANQAGNYRLASAPGGSFVGPPPSGSEAYAPSARYSEVIKKTIIDRKSDPKNNVAFETGVYKEGVTKAKSQATQSKASKYDFSIGSVVLHKFDPIRVFVQNPLVDPGQNQWYCAFAGFIDSKPYTQDFTRGVSAINVTCQDIRMRMQHMRTRGNPAAQQVNSNVLNTESGKAVVNGQTIPLAKLTDFRDFTSKNSGRSSHPIGGYTFGQSITWIFHGEELNLKVSKTLDYGVSGVKAVGYGGANAGTPTSPSVFSVVSAPTVFFKPGETDKLEDWTNTVLFGAFGRFMDIDEVIKLGTNTFPGGSGSPESYVLRTLYPVAGSAANNGIEFSFDKNATARIEWVTRYELLSTICRNVDYQCYVSGFGDFIIEFPMYDFDVSDFNSFRDLYTFDKQVINDNINDEGGPFVSVVEVNSAGQLNQNVVNKAQDGNAANSRGLATPAQATSTAIAMALMSRLGPVQEVINKPGITNPQNIALIAQMELMKRISQFDIFDFTATFRPFLTVNRPVYYVTKQRIAVSRSVSYNWNFRESADVQLDLVYPRKMSADGSFRYITGAGSVPISYNAIYEQLTNTSGSGLANAESVPEIKSPLKVDAKQARAADESNGTR